MAEKLLSAEQVDAVIEFSQALANYANYGYWNPFLSNQYLQGLNNNPKSPNSQKIRSALTDYRNNAENLQSFMEFAQFFDMLFSRTIYHYTNALSFDLQYACTNAYTQADYESEEYQADKRRVQDFLNKFNYKQEFRNVVKQLMLHEVYYVWFRKTKWKNKGMKYALQVLPQDRCLLTGYWEKGLLFDFDMSYFLMTGTDIDGFDPNFKKYYQRVFGDKTFDITNYRPTNAFSQRDGTYAMWTQTSPLDGAWAFKFDTSNFNTTPFLAPFLKSVLNNDEIQQLQYDKDIAEAFGILAGEIATFDNAKSGTQSDQMIFKPSTLAGFMASAKAGLDKNIKLAALPTKNLKWYQFNDSNKDMYNDQLKTSAATGTGASRIIYSTDRMSNAEVEAALNETYQTMKPLYAQFSNFLDYYVNQITKKYKFRFIFDGATYSFERNGRFDRLTKMADKGLVLSPSAWASAYGIEPQIFEAQLRESKYSNWLDEYSQLMININTTAQEGTLGESSKPKTETPDDSTERNYDQ